MKALKVPSWLRWASRTMTMMWKRWRLTRRPSERFTAERPRPSYPKRLRVLMPETQWQLNGAGSLWQHGSISFALPKVDFDDDAEDILVEEDPSSSEMDFHVFGQWEMLKAA